MADNADFLPVVLFEEEIYDVEVSDGMIVRLRRKPTGSAVA
jgi:hypothetical protein